MKKKVIALVSDLQGSRDRGISMIFEIIGTPRAWLVV